MITSIKAFKESILVPRNLDDRQEKLKQKNYALLQQEVIEGDFDIDENWVFDNPIVKTKKIIGNVYLYELDHIPVWLENIEIDGDFFCDGLGLSTLKGCPKIVRGMFSCKGNTLETLEYGPTNEVKNYYCYNNALTSLIGAPEEIWGDFNCSWNYLESLEGLPKIINGDFICDFNRGDLDLRKDEIRAICQVDQIHIM